MEEQSRMLREGLRKLARVEGGHREGRLQSIKPVSRPDYPQRLGGPTRYRATQRTRPKPATAAASTLGLAHCSQLNNKRLTGIAARVDLQTNAKPEKGYQQ